VPGGCSVPPQLPPRASLHASCSWLAPRSLPLTIGPRRPPRGAQQHAHAACTRRSPSTPSNAPAPIRSSTVLCGPPTPSMALESKGGAPTASSAEQSSSEAFRGSSRRERGSASAACSSNCQPVAHDASASMRVGLVRLARSDHKLAIGSGGRCSGVSGGGKGGCGTGGCGTGRWAGGGDDGAQVTLRCDHGPAVRWVQPMYEPPTHARLEQ
jgi:hypothetical protein